MHCLLICQGLQRFCIEHKVKLSKACNFSQFSPGVWAFAFLLLFDEMWVSYCRSLSFLPSAILSFEKLFSVFCIRVWSLTRIYCLSECLVGMPHSSGGYACFYVLRSKLIYRPFFVQIDHIFLTRVGSETAGGLPGMYIDVLSGSPGTVH